MADYVYLNGERSAFEWETLRANYDRQAKVIAALIAERDDAYDALHVEAEAHDADVAQYTAERDTARRECARACEERDEALSDAAGVRAMLRLVAVERDEFRRKLRAAHCERDRLARTVEGYAVLRERERHFECEHGVRVAIRREPGGVAENDVDV